MVDRSLAPSVAPPDSTPGQRRSLLGPGSMNLPAQAFGGCIFPTWRIPDSGLRETKTVSDF